MSFKALTIAALIALLAGTTTAQEVETKQYDDGGIYEGTFRNGKQHGQGTYRLPNGYEYVGEWVDGE
ncbi:MAG: 2-isopropylmalate synthase, partial [Shimia sp.]